MNKGLIIAILLAVVLAFGCIGSPSQRTGSPAGGVGTSTDGSGTTGSSGATPDFVVRPAPGVSGRAVVLNPLGDYNACLSDCQIVTGSTQGACRVGCILEYAEADRNVGHCDSIYSVAGVEDLRDTYYNGCLDVVGGAMGSIAPCSMVRGSAGLVARKNACISAVASESRQPALCDAMEQDNIDSDPQMQARYDESLRQIIQDCRDSSQ